MYAKIHSQIFDSSIAKDHHIRHIFMDLLVLADPEGIVDMTYDSIAGRTNIPVEIIREAIGKLCKPDVNSRTHEHEGARLLRLDDERDWGWRIVNYKLYHGFHNNAARREYMRDYMRRRREKKEDVNTVNINGKLCKQVLNTETETETEKSTQEDSTNLLSLTRTRKKPASKPTPKRPKSKTSWGPLAGWTIDPEDNAAWVTAYPACDIDRQLAAMHAWLLANPLKAVKKNWSRFIVNWLSKEQQRGGDANITESKNGQRRSTAGQLRGGPSGGITPIAGGDYPTGELVDVGIEDPPS